MSLEHSPVRGAAHLPRIVRWPEVHELIGKSRTQIWRDVRAGKFPAPVKIGPNSVGWYLDEILAHVAALNRVHYAPDSKTD